MANNTDDLHKQIQNAAAVVRQFSGCAAYQALIAMLDATVSSYHQDLMVVTQENLPKLQAAAAQAMAIRKVVAGDERESPRV